MITSNKIFSRIGLIGLLILFLSPTWAQQSQKVTAKYVSGEVKYQKKSKGDWKPVRVGAKIRHKDRIRTFAASKLEIEFANGTSLVIDENSIVSMKELLEKGDAKNTTIDVKKGNVLFNIKKLASKKSSFKFESVTATAAIRGTSGGFGYYRSGSVVYLKTGALDLSSPKGRLYKIKKNELAIEQKEGFVVRRFKNKEALQGVLDQIKEIEKNTDSNATATNAPDIDSLLSTLPDSLSSELIDTSVEIKDTTTSSSKQSQLAQLGSYPSQVNVPELQLSGTCPEGALAVVGALSVETKQRAWSLKIRWAEHEEGQKSFVAYCLLKTDKYDLGTVVVDYSRPPQEFALSLASPTSVKVSNGKVNVSGSYSGKDTRLTLTAGSRSVDLSTPTKTFNYDYIISDATRTWNLNQLTLKLKGSEGETSETISIDVDRTSRKVNTLPPIVGATIDQIKGVIRVNITQLEGDIAKAQFFVDGDMVQDLETDKDIIGYSLPLQAGNRNYEIVVEDQAGNIAKKTLSGVTYYPRVIFQIQISSPTPAGRIRVPPMPPGRKENLRELIEVRLRNIPDDNPAYIQEINVINEVANFRRVLRANQINNVFFDVDVPLKRGSKNRIIVRIIPKNGPVQEAVKEIEIVR